MRVNFQRVVAIKQKERMDKLVDKVMTSLETGQPLCGHVKAAQDAMEALEIIIRKLNKEIWVADDFLRGGEEEKILFCPRVATPIWMSWLVNEEEKAYSKEPFGKYSTRICTVHN